MNIITVERTDEKNLRFKGEEIAGVRTSSNNAAGNYSGSPGRFTELNLYRTAKGKYVCERIQYTCWVREHDMHYGLVCDTTDEVTAFFGFNELAKDLYQAAEIDVFFEVE